MNNILENYEILHISNTEESISILVKEKDTNHLINFGHINFEQISDDSDEASLSANVIVFDYDSEGKLIKLDSSIEQETEYMQLLLKIIEDFVGMNNE